MTAYRKLMRAYRKWRLIENAELVIVAPSAFSTMHGCSIEYGRLVVHEGAVVVGMHIYGNDSILIENPSEMRQVAVNTLDVLSAVRKEQADE